MAFLPYLKESGWEESVARLGEARDVFEEIGDREGADRAGDDIPYFMFLGGGVVEALPLMEEALVRARGRDDVFNLMDHLMRVAEARLKLGQHDQARARLLEGVELNERADIPGGMAAFLMSLATVELAAGRPERSMRLYGAGQAIYETVEGPDPRPSMEDPREAARAAMGEEAADRALAEGRAMSREEALAYARKAHT
jgi:hypothetical protein